MGDGDKTPLRLQFNPKVRQPASAGTWLAAFS